MKRIPVGLVGVSGYTGMELARLLTQHESFELVRATSRAEAGKPLGDIYPFLQGLQLAQVEITKPDAADLADACQLVFLAVPHGAAMQFAGKLRRRGIKVVDLSADFRLRDVAVYSQWYGLDHTEADLLEETVYGLPEFYAKQIAGASLVANPGCYPTASILGLAPALRQKLIVAQGIVIDAKSGTTGAGRKASVGTLFCEVADTFRAYNLTKHRHTPEIEQELAALTGAAVPLSFNTHLLPINRGILATIYTTLAQPLTTEQAVQTYTQAYADQPWVRVLPPGRLPETRNVRGSMFCDIGLVVDERLNRLIIVSAIDNLCRGASGMALANANLMNGLDMAEVYVPRLLPLRRLRRQYNGDGVAVDE